MECKLCYRGATYAISRELSVSRELDIRATRQPRYLANTSHCSLIILRYRGVFYILGNPDCTKVSTLKINVCKLVHIFRLSELIRPLSSTSPIPHKFLQRW